MNRYFSKTRCSYPTQPAIRAFSAPFILGLAILGGVLCPPNLAAAQDAGSPLSRLQAQIDELKSQVQELQALLPLGDFISVESDTINGLTGPHVIIEGANVHIRSGGGSTADMFTGRGNLVVGYNELPTGFVDGQRAGAHNLIVGPEHRYSSFGGFAAGILNTISGQHASVSGGRQNTASALESSVSGGGANIASARQASVSGGGFNTASGLQSSVSGGQTNTASGIRASVSGGIINRASNTFATVSGGANNEASGAQATVSGGAERAASGLNNWVGGGLLQNN